MINWKINKNGILKVYINNKILFKEYNCKNMTKDEVELLILEETSY